MLLEAKALCKEFSRRGTRFFAVDKADFQVAEGDFIGLSGRSGSGKTTLLTMLAGLARPTSGSIVLDGHTDLFRLGDAAMAALRGKSVSFIPQGQSLLSNLTIVDNVRLPSHLSPDREEDPGRAEYLLAEVGLADLVDAYPSHLSGGEMRRAAVARALMTRPRLILADEPTGDLDESNADTVMKLLEKATVQGTAVIFSTHEPEALRRAGRIFLMTEGRLCERVADERMEDSA